MITTFKIFESDESVARHQITEYVNLGNNSQLEYVLKKYSGDLEFDVYRNTYTPLTPPVMGYTPLLFAAGWTMENKQSIIMTLLRHGANIGATTPKGEVIFDLINDLVILDSLRHLYPEEYEKYRMEKTTSKYNL